MTALDLLVVGSGVAGLTAALRALEGAPGARVGVVAKAELSASATAWAQGGVAAVLDDSEVTLDARSGGDSADLHVADTLAAGAGLCDRPAVEILTADGPDAVRRLVELGAVFDRSPAGGLELAREGGHSVARVVHAGGAATGAEVQRCLVEAVRGSGARLWEGTFATDLIVEGGRCRGVRAFLPDGTETEVRATHTLLATGGAGQLFAVTTNPATSTADGVAMALRAGVAVADLEFTQFHPTALHHPSMPRPLLSEALRGEGALLLDPDGRRFVDELAPRDVVSRAMAERMLAAGADHVWLDARGVPELEERFASLVAAVAAAGFDAAADLLPVAPAAHYLCGGVLTDLDGASALPGLWAAGEVACTGVHGANRLASNSLLEGLVFATRAVRAILGGADGPRPTGALAPLLGAPGVSGSDSADEGAAAAIPVERLATAMRAPAAPPHAAGARRTPAEALASLQQAMTRGAGVVRSAASLGEVRRTLDDLGSAASVGAAGAGGAAGRSGTGGVGAGGAGGGGPGGAGASGQEAGGAGVPGQEAGGAGGAGQEAGGAGVPGQEAGGAGGAGDAAHELANLHVVARAVLDAAQAREETRGCHSRSDHPAASDRWRRRLVHGGLG